MKESNYKSYDELPLFLNANIVSKVLGISSSSGYELMHTDGFPVLKIGSRDLSCQRKSSVSGWSRIQEEAFEI